MTIEFGLLLPINPCLEAISQYAPMMAGHIQSLWMTDHFFWNDNPTQEAWTVISYLAAHFPQYKVGTLVLGQAYRNPALPGKMGATLQYLSQGRFILGMGAGWKEDEHLAYGYEFPTAGTRIAQLEEAIIIIKRLWYDENPMTYYGRHYRIQDAYCEPKPDPVPPIMIGGGGRNTLRVTAQHANWWNFSAKTPQLYAEKLNILHQHCEYLGRNPDDIRLTWLGKLEVAASKKAAKSLSEDATLRGTPEQIIEQIQAFVDLGIDYFIFEMNQLHDPDAISLLTNELLPEIRALKASIT